jgi:acetyltransferase-like isoleucine patch superfamily enzyme
VNDAAPFIHETAIVEPGAELGSGTKVWHHAHVRAGASLGRECSLGKNVFVDAGVRIGNGVRIQNNVSVYAGVTIEDEVFVGPSAVFTNDLYPRAHGSAWVAVPTIVRTGASVGANATLICGVEIGSWAMVAAGAIVTKSVAPNQLVLGQPARAHGWVCWCGHLVARAVKRPVNAVCEHCGRTLGSA